MIRCDCMVRCDDMIKSRNNSNAMIFVINATDYNQQNVIMIFNSHFKGVASHGTLGSILGLMKG